MPESVMKFRIFLSDVYENVFKKRHQGELEKLQKRLSKVAYLHIQ